MRSATKKRTGRDKAYLAWIHTLPCAILFCTSNRYPGEHSSVIEAHHAGERGLSQKADDRTAIPLCQVHHRLGRDSAHVLGKQFWFCHKLNPVKLIAEYQARFDAEQGGK